MSGGSLTAYLACVTMSRATELDLRSRIQGPFPVTPLPAAGTEAIPASPLQVFTSSDLGALLSAGLQWTERPPQEGGLAFALHVAPDEAALTETHARDAVWIALTARSSCFLASAAAARLLHGALPHGCQLRSLGRQRRRDLAPTEELHLIHSEGTAEAVPQLNVLREEHTNLPVAHTPFVGRQRELAALGAAILEHQLVTVIGPVGAGKSRLALQAAAALSDAFADGISYLDLSQAPEVPPDWPLAFRGRHLLLLDNVEHLTDSISPVIRNLLQVNPDLRIVCTSLVPLGLPSEHRFPLPPLSLTPTEGAVHSEAVELFLGLASTAAPAPPIYDLDLVSELCRALDGVPLAIEYASELAPVVPLDQLARRLRIDLALLTTQKAGVPSRHRSMRDAIARNCALVSPEAQKLFSRLSIFQEWFTLAAAEAVCPDESLAASQVLHLLRELTHASLVLIEQRQGTPAYCLLSAPRLYGRSCLDAAGETAAVQVRHRDWFLNLVEQINRSKDRTRWSQMDWAYLNMEAALQWALDTGDGTIAQRFCTALSGYWSSRGELKLGYKLLQQALQLPSVSANHHTKALTTAGCMAGDLGELPAGEALLREAIIRWRDLPDQVELARTLMNLGVALRRQGRYEEAEAAYRESLSIQTGLPDQSDLVLTYLNLGAVLGTRGEQQQAVLQFQAALDTARRIGDQWGAATALSQLARAAVVDKRLDDAVTYQTEALVLFRGMGDQLGTAVTLSSLASVCRELGDLDQALCYFRECITIALKMGRVTTLLDTMDQLMQVLVALKQLEVVARLLGFCEAARQRESVPRSPHLAFLVNTLAEESTKALGGTWFGALYRAGSLMSLAQAIDVATSAVTPIIPLAPAQERPLPDQPAPASTEELSPREVQIIHLLVEGLSSRELGERLFLSPRTVEKHLERLRQRLGVPNKARLVAWALQNGFGRTQRR